MINVLLLAAENSGTSYPEAIVSVAGLALMGFIMWLLLR